MVTMKQKFKINFSSERCLILIQVSFIFANGPSNNNLALFHVMV